MSIADFMLCNLSIRVPVCNVRNIAYRYCQWAYATWGGRDDRDWDIQAGVAWLMVLVTTRPVLMPFSFAASRMEPTGWPSSSTAIATMGG